jgi:carbamoyl-phosphate synthase large subunit
VDGKNYAATRKIALKHCVNGIVTGQMEKPLRLMAKLAQELGYRFNSPDVVETSLDKWLMKLAFRKAGIPCAKAMLISKSDDLTTRRLDAFSFPLIIKPRDAFSSRGVYKVNRLEEIIDHIQETRSFASNGDVLMEEFLEGKEFSVESITFKGKTSVIQITEKFITPFPNTVELGHLQPAPVTPEQHAAISKVVGSAIGAIGIDDSASHAEVMLTSEGPMMIEIGARLGGDFIASYLTKASTGVSMDKAAVQIALGITPDLDKRHDRFSYIKYIELPAGKKVVNVEPFEDLLKLPDLVFAHIFVKPGDVIQPITHSALRSACVIAAADTREEVIHRTRKYADLLMKKIILEPGRV